MVKLLLDRGGQIDAKTRVSLSIPCVRCCPFLGTDWDFLLACLGVFWGFWGFFVFFFVKLETWNTEIHSLGIQLQ